MPRPAEQEPRFWICVDLRGFVDFGRGGFSGGDHPSEACPRMDIILATVDDGCDLRADNARHDLYEPLVVGFVAALCGTIIGAGIADFGWAKEHVSTGFLRHRPWVPLCDTDPTVFRMIDPKALDAAFGRVLASVAALLGVPESGMAPLTPGKCAVTINWITSKWPRCWDCLGTAESPGRAVL